jgi:hypothetical protein
MDRFKSQKNNDRLGKLSNELGFSSIRLMFDPQAIPESSEAVIEDICLFLEEELHPDLQNKPFLSFGSKR